MNNKSIGLSGSTLKIIACVIMTIDHIGAYLFPGLLQLRIIGRIAFPIFAFFIAEGCVYTGNKWKRLLKIAILGAFCEAIYYLFFREFYGNILLTFTLSVTLISVMQEIRNIIPSRKIIAWVGFLFLLAFVYKLSGFLGVDYGFFGVMVPVITAFFDKPNQTKYRILAFCAALLLLVCRYGFTNIQAYCVMAVPFIAFYNGKPGAKKLKNVFYVFYPLHLALIWLVGLIMQYV